VVSCCLLDPDADEWLDGITDLAKCPWLSDVRCEPQIRGRARVLDRWALEASTLLEAALVVCQRNSVKDLMEHDPRSADVGHGLRPSRPASKARLGVSRSKVKLLLLGDADRGEKYTSIGHIAKRIGCSKSTVSAAINSSPILEKWKQLGLSNRRRSGVSSLTKKVLAKQPQKTEPDPAQAASDTGPDDDAILEMLIEESEPDGRAAIHSMPPAQQKELVSMIRKNSDLIRDLSRRRNNND
jgi:hypothetical protein